jgi:hypothetical protein
MAQSPPPVAPASAAGTAPSRAGRAASIPAACGLDLNDLMRPSSGQTPGVSHRARVSHRAFSGTEAAEFSLIRASGAKHGIARSAFRANLRQVDRQAERLDDLGGRCQRPRGAHDRTATCSRPPGTSTAALSRGHPAASTHPAGHRMSPAGRPRPRRNHRPAATRPAAPGLSGLPRNPATVSTYPGGNCPARRGYKVSFFCRIECVEQADIYAPAGMLTHGSASRVVSSAAPPVFRIPYAAPAILPDVRLDDAQQQLVCAIYLLARGNYPLQEKMDHVLRASGGNCASSLVSALVLTLG